MFRPHDREQAKFKQIGRTSDQGADMFIFFLGQAMFGYSFFADCVHKIDLAQAKAAKSGKPSPGVFVDDG